MDFIAYDFVNKCRSNSSAFVQSLVTSGILTPEQATAAADLYRVWQLFLQRKDFFDLTGNGVNHPNDYGHRILANTALSLFEPSRLDF